LLSTDNKSILLLLFPSWRILGISVRASGAKPISDTRDKQDSQAKQKFLSGVPMRRLLFLLFLLENRRKRRSKRRENSRSICQVPG